MWKYIWGEGGGRNESLAIREITLIDFIIAIFPPKAILTIDLRMPNKNARVNETRESILFSASSASADFCATIFLLLFFFSKCVFKCILDYQDRGHPYHFQSLIKAKICADRAPHGLGVQSRDNGIAESRETARVPVLATTLAKGRKFSRESIQTLGERELYLSFLRPSSRRDRKTESDNTPWPTAGEPLTPQLSLLFTPDSARFVGAPASRRPTPDIFAARHAR